MRKPLDIDALNELYSEAETCDQELFAEQRSNVLLVSGDHFSKKGSRFWQRIRESKDIANETKLRLTKNHLHKICNTYVNAIVSHAPGVAISAKNENELQDQKAAELHSSVWQHIKHTHKIKKKIREWVKDYVDVGEHFVKIFWDPNIGQLVGFEALTDPDTGQVLVHPDTGKPVESDIPVFSGDLVFERIFAPNILRSAQAKSMDESHFLCYRKMVDVETLKSLVGNDEKKLKWIEEGMDETYTVFDAGTGTYSQSKKECLLREFYFRKCPEYPNGYYYFATKSGILVEGELPLGIFPIKYVGFDEVTTTPRSRSILKQLRPWQAEISRCSSKIAETQITSDDKLLIQHGTKISQGGSLPGIRSVQFTGMAPQFLAGRSGDQYLPYLNAQIEELYRVANVAEENEERNEQMDPHTMLYRSIRNKKKFVLYAEKIESHLIEVADAALRLYKAYAPESLLIPAIGRREFINIAEFKRADDLGYQIKIEPQSDDPETKLGRLLTMNTIIQYAGNKLEKDDIGKLIQLSDYANNTQAFDDWTADYRNATNDILALDRGEYPAPNFHDDHPKIIKRLISRKKQADFRFLDPRIQQLYDMKIKAHEEMEALVIQKSQAAKSGWIPTSGNFIGCDFYVQDPKDPLKTRRARFPQDSLAWLKKQLEAQGVYVDKFLAMDPGVQADLSERLTQTSALGAPTPSSPVSGALPMQPMGQLSLM